MLDMVRNPEDQFSCVGAHFICFLSAVLVKMIVRKR